MKKFLTAALVIAFATTVAGCAAMPPPKPALDTQPIGAPPPPPPPVQGS